jgi:hypothetical protein
VQYIAPKASPLVRDVHSGPVPLPPVVPEIANHPSIIASKLGSDESKPAKITGSDECFPPLAFPKSETVS